MMVVVMMVVVMMFSIAGHSCFVISGRRFGFSLVMFVPF